MALYNDNELKSISKVIHKMRYKKDNMLKDIKKRWKVVKAIKNKEVFIYIQIH